MTLPKLISPSLIVAVLVAILAALVLNTAYTYNWTSGLFPRLIGWVFLGLALIEVGGQITALLRARVTPGDSSDATPDGEPELNVWKEIKGFLWLGTFLASLYLVGFMVSTPLYVFSFLRLSGQRSLGMSAAIAAGATAIVYVVFVRLLEYRLFGGVLLG